MKKMRKEFPNSFSVARENGNKIILPEPKRNSGKCSRHHWISNERTEKFPAIEYRLFVNVSLLLLIRFSIYLIFNGRKLMFQKKRKIQIFFKSEKRLVAEKEASIQVLI